jgi:fluoride exporter
MSALAVDLLWVALGSAFGGMARFAVSGIVARGIGELFPWGTMVCNVTGSFAIGAAAAAAYPTQWSGAWPLAVTGFLGCYTTVSSFSLQTLALAREGDTAQAVANILLSLLLCLGAVTAGYAAVHGGIAASP